MREGGAEHVLDGNGSPSRAIAHPLFLIAHPYAIAALLAIALGGCGTFSSRPPAPLPPGEGSPRAGGYYLDDGPPANPPADLDRTPDAVPKPEPIRPANSRPYVALGTSYRPMTELRPYKARGLATWYGRRYHGKPTASGEIYDMYAMTAAHTILPIPSYVRVTNLRNGRSVVLRVNDRGPFVDGRLIDVSYAAAHKLGILGGATMVEVELILPGDEPATIAATPPIQADGRAATTVGGAASEPERPVAKPEPVAAVATIPAPTAAPVAITASPPAAPAPLAVASGRVFLQLGAFASRENADGFLARVRSQADWLALEVVTRDGLHRVQAGPYATAGDARQAAERVTQSLGIKPVVQMR